MTLNQRLEAFLATVPTLRLPAIAKILGAEEFIAIDIRAKAWKFNVAGYVNWCELADYQPAIPTSYTILQNIVLPPDDIEIYRGSKRGMRPVRRFPRARMTQEVIGQLGLSYRVIEGCNTPNMMREESYKIFVLENHLVFVNDCEGEATYIVDKSSDWFFYMSKRKSELRQMENVSRIFWRKDPLVWKAIISTVLRFGPIIAPEPQIEGEAWPTPPSGSISIHALSLEIGKKPEDLEKIASSVAADVFVEQPVECHVYMAKTRQAPTMHCSAALAQLLRLMFPVVEKKGDLIPAPVLARKYKRTNKTIVRLAELLADENQLPRSEHIKIRKARNLPVECFSKELASIIEANLPDPSWFGLGKIMMKTNFGEDKIRRLTAQYVSPDNAVVSGEFFSRELRRILFVHPDVFNWIVSQRLPLPEAGWEFLADLGAPSNREAKTVAVAIREILIEKGLPESEHLKWFRGIGASDRGRLAASPIASAAYRELEAATRPDDSMTIEELAEEWNVTRSLVYHMLRQMGNDWPKNRQYFGVTRGFGDSRRFYLKPEIIHKLRELRKSRTRRE